MKQKKEKNDSWGVVILICITLLVVLALCMKIMPKDCVVMFLATVFMAGCYIYLELEQVRVRKAAILIQAHVTDCEMVDYWENNRKQVKYLLTCEAYDAKFYGNAQPDIDILAKENILRATYLFIGVVWMGLGGAYFFVVTKQMIEQKDRKEMIQYGIIYFVTGIVWAIISFVCDVI